MQYHIYKDNVKIKETTSKQVEITGLKPKTTYTLGVSAYNGLRESTRATVTMTTRGLVMIVDKTLPVNSEVTLEYMEYPLGAVPLGTEPAGMFGGGNRQTLKGNVISVANGQSRIELKTSFDKLPDELKLATNLQVPGLNLLSGTNQTIKSVDAPTTGWVEGVTYETTQNLNEREYTLSFEAKADISGQKIANYLWHGGKGGSNIVYGVIESDGTDRSNVSDGFWEVTLSNSWEKYYITYKIHPDNTKKIVIVGRRFKADNTSGKIYIRNVKLEVGTHATTWTPARKDIYGTDQVDAGYSAFDGYKAIYLK